MSKKTYQKWLSVDESYTLHNPMRTKFPTNRVIVSSVDQQRQTDLVDLNRLQKYNQGFCYILTFIDILSKYAWEIFRNEKNGGYCECLLIYFFQSENPSPSIRMLERNIRTDTTRDF